MDDGDGKFSWKGYQAIQPFFVLRCIESTYIIWKNTKMFISITNGKENRLQIQRTSPQNSRMYVPQSFFDISFNPMNLTPYEIKCHKCTSILCHWVSFWVPSLARSRTNSGGHHWGGRRPPRQRCFLKAEAILKATTVVATTAHCQRPRSRTILSALCASAEHRIGTEISSVARIWLNILVSFDS